MPGLVNQQLRTHLPQTNMGRALPRFHARFVERNLGDLGFMELTFVFIQGVAAAILFFLRRGRSGPKVTAAFASPSSEVTDAIACSLLGSESSKSNGTGFLPFLFPKAQPHGI